MASQIQNKSALKSVTKVNFRSGTYLWTIENYRSVHDKLHQILKSTSFSVGSDGFRWKLHLDTYYNNGKMISLRLYPDDVTYDNFNKHCPILINNLKFAIMNSENKETNVKKSEFILTNYSSAGFNDFITRDILLDSKLLPDDKLTILCELSYAKNTDISNSAWQ